MREPAAPLVVEATGVPTEQEQLFDQPQLQEMLELAGEGFDGLVGQFDVNAHAQLALMRAALQVHDSAALRRAVHKLKGGSATLGAAALAALCDRLEGDAVQSNLEHAAQQIEAIAMMAVTVSRELHVIARSGLAPAAPVAE